MNRMCAFVLVGLGCAEAPAPVVTPPSAPKPAVQAAPVAESSARREDLLARIAEFAKLRPGATDGEFYLYRSPHATVHMHIIGVGQMCPLHIHRSTHEATVIVAGMPQVDQVWGDNGGLVSHQKRASPGDLVVSKPYCGHAWSNLEPTLQANLVIASPRFDGNLYLYPDDQRMLPGPPPLWVHAAERLADQPGSTRMESVDALDGQLSLALVYDELPVHDKPGHDTILVVAEGTGTLADQPLSPGIAIVLVGGEPERLRAQTPMAVWLFQPPSPSQEEQSVPITDLKPPPG